MKLSIHKLENQSYSHKDEVLPFVFKVEFEEQLVIGDDLRATNFLLKHRFDELFQAGGLACITAIKRGEEIVGPNRPKFLLINVLEDGDDLGVLISGTYTLLGCVVGSVKTPQGFKPFELKSELQVDLE